MNETMQLISGQVPPHVNYLITKLLDSSTSLRYHNCLVSLRSLIKLHAKLSTQQGANYLGINDRSDLFV